MDVVVIISVKYDKNLVIENKIEIVQKSKSFREIFNVIYVKYFLDKYFDASLTDKCVKVSPNKTDWYDIDFDYTLSSALVVTDVKHVKFQCSDNINAVTEKPVSSSRSLTDVLMKKTRALLQPLEETNNKNKLHNQVLKDIQNAADGELLVKGFNQNDGTKTLKLLTDVLWYLDGRSDTIIDASKHRDIPLPPERFNMYKGFNDWTKNKNKPRIERHECRTHAVSLVTLVSKKTIFLPTPWKEDILKLSSTLSGYEDYLSSMNENQKRRHESLVPIRKLADHITGQTFAAVEKDKVKESLRKLSNIMKSKKHFDYTLIDDDSFEKTLTPVQRHNDLQNISLEVPVQVIRYDPGGGIKVLVFIQRIPELMSDQEISNALVRFQATIQPNLPTYHTRAMRKVFMEQVKLLAGGQVPSHVSRSIYRSLTGDASAEICSSEIDKRVQLALETNDADLIIDLRHLNPGRPGDTFQVFFDEAIKYVEEITAADERRHGVAHMSEFLSIRDLIE